MNKGNGRIILLFSLILSSMIATLSLAPLVYAQEEKQPVAEFTIEEIPFVVFWQNLFSTWGQAIADNLVNALAFFVVIGVGYFVGKGVSGALSRVLKRIFKDYLHSQLTEKDLEEKSSWSQITTLIPFTAKWFVWIYAFVIAIDLLGFEQASEWLGVLWAFLPNIIAFIILIAVGIIVSRVALKWLGEYKPDLFGTHGTMQIIKSLVNAIIFAFIFGIGVTQLGIGENIIPIVFWTVLAGTMGIFIASAVGLRHAVTSWSFGESLKHLGMKKGAEIAIQKLSSTSKEASQEEKYEVIEVGITHTKIKQENRIKLIPNIKFREQTINITKEAPESKSDGKKSKDTEDVKNELKEQENFSKIKKDLQKTDEQTGKESETS